MLSWMAALLLGAAPRRVWPAFERHVPLTRAAAAAGAVTMLAGFFAGVGGFLDFATRTAGANNSWMLRTLASGGPDSAALVPYGVSVLTLFIFLFLTPLGWLSCYLTASGFLRAVSGWLDDPRGDPLLSIIDGAAISFAEKRRRRRSRETRERREGTEARDVLVTGGALGLGADYVVLASRRKAEWTAGATIMTSDQWYRLGEPYDLETPAGLRTAYPLTKFDTLEAVRRGIEYELPALSGRAARLPRKSS
jgi:hypothetical protein